jgi:hypothetical protein
MLLVTKKLIKPSGTVISIYEDAYPGVRPLSKHQNEVVKVARRNLVNVFCELSKCPTARARRTAMSTLQLRVGTSPLHPDDTLDAVVDDTPGMLFYYLFDDWSSSYGLVARKEYQYGAELDRMVSCPSDWNCRTLC